MRFLAFISMFLLTGCVGSSTPHNPMERVAPTQEAWWRKDTTNLSKENNPWNKFLPVYTEVDRSNPWGEFKEPELFPGNWKHKDTGRIKPTGSIKEIPLSEVEKTHKQRLDDLKKREREYFKRSI